MIVYTTKWVLTSGILEIDGEFIESGSFYGKHKTSVYKSLFSKDNVFLTYNEATKDAEEKRKKKIKSLENQIAKLKNMKFR